MKTTKHNPTPRAPFNLRLTGPMRHSDIRERLGQGFKMASKNNDLHATVDHDPCPHCNAAVEWAATSKSEHGKIVQFVYGRCQGRDRHAWGFSNTAVKRDHATVTDLTPPPRPSAGTFAMASWIERKAADLEEQIKALQELKRLTAVVGRPAIFQSPTLPVPPNGDPTPPIRY